MSLDFDDLLDNSTKPTHESAGEETSYKKEGDKSKC